MVTPQSFLDEAGTLFETSGRWYRERLLPGDLPISIKGRQELEALYDQITVYERVAKTDSDNRIDSEGEHPAVLVGDASEKSTLEVTYTPNPEDASTIWSTTSGELGKLQRMVVVCREPFFS